MNDPQAMEPTIRIRVVNSSDKSERDADPLVAGLGRSLVLGREGDLPLGVVPPDTGISRRALTITAVADGWTVETTNANGVALQPWGQAASWLDRGTHIHLGWQRAALRVIGSRAELQHWVLLEHDAAVLPGQLAESTETDKPDPRPLTPAQIEAVTAVFAEHLAWPPVAGPVPHTLDAAARRIGVSTAAIYQRLEAARQRAYQLGSHQQANVTEPDYVYVLTRNRFIDQPRHQ